MLLVESCSEYTTYFKNTYNCIYLLRTILFRRWTTFNEFRLLIWNKYLVFLDINKTRISTYSLNTILPVGQKKTCLHTKIIVLKTKVPKKKNLLFDFSFILMLLNHLLCLYTTLFNNFILDSSMSLEIINICALKRKIN